MALSATHLADKSALARIPHPAVAARVRPLLDELAQRGQHRLPIPDLIIAATAESADLTLLHYDGDYELIAAVTGQAHEWVVPRGSL